MEMVKTYSLMFVPMKNSSVLTNLKNIFHALGSLPEKPWCYEFTEVALPHSQVFEVVKPYVKKMSQSRAIAQFAKT